MATLKEEAQAYEPPQTKNIAESEKVSIDMDIKTDHGKGRDGKEFSYKFIEVEGQQYRVPNSVIGGIKALLKKFPTIREISVMKDGEGMNTRYQVIPMHLPGENILDNN